MGYMGAGKSTVGRVLAEKLGLKFYDLDAEIEAQTGHSIAEIFANKGEIHFRRLESTLLVQLLAKAETAVIALGGGTPAYGANLTHILQKPHRSIYLKAQVGNLVKQLESERQNRPLIQQVNANDLPEYIAKHVFERQTYYAQAQYTVAVDHRSPEQIAAEIQSLLF